ncbi:MAG: DUF1559 family PulG-like putative transporter, partial [Planctomycetota bacterium]
MAVDALTAALTAGILAAAAGCPATSSAPEAPLDVQCEHKLQDLGEAIAAYRSEHGDLPQVVSGPGNLQHSWRVVIAPYVLASLAAPEEFDYRFDEPFDSKHNRDCLLKSVPISLYTCPFESAFAANPGQYAFATYVMLVRPTPPGPNAGSNVK